jgi:hypothetical protein
MTVSVDRKHFVSAGAEPAFKRMTEDHNLDCGNNDPIKFIEDKVKELSGRKDFSKVKGFKIRGEDEKNEVGRIRSVPFKRKDGAQCFSFYRNFTVQFKDRDGNEHTLVFQKRIYTSVKIPMKILPQSKISTMRGKQPKVEIDTEAYDNAISLAGIASTAYANSVQNALKFKNDENKGGFGPDAKEKVEQLQKNGKVWIGMQKEGKTISHNMESPKLEHAKQHRFTHIRNEVDGFEIFYSKVKDKDKQVAQKIEHGKFYNRLQRGLQNPQRYEIDPDECEGEMKTFIGSMKLLKVRDRKTEDLEEHLDELNIHPHEYLSYLQPHRDGLAKEFEENLDFFYDIDKLDNLMMKYGETEAPISEEIKAKLKERMPKIRPKKPKKNVKEGKEKPMKRPKVAPLPLAIKAVFANDRSSTADKEAMQRLAAALHNAREGLHDIHRQLKKDEDELLTLNRSRFLARKIKSEHDYRTEQRKSSHLPKIGHDIRTFDRNNVVDEDEEVEGVESEIKSSSYSSYDAEDES